MALAQSNVKCQGTSITRTSPRTLSTWVVLFVKHKHLTSVQSSLRAGVANHKPSAWKEHELCSRETRLHNADAHFP